MSGQQETAMVCSLSNVGNGLSEHSVAKTQPSYKETQLASGASLVVGCGSEVQAVVEFPAHTTQSGDVDKDHKIVGLEEKLQNEIENRTELEEQLKLVTHEKDELEAQLRRVKQSCEDEVNLLKFELDNKCKELESCKHKLAEKEKELDGLNEQCLKEVKEAKAQADKKVKSLKEEYDCKVLELKKEAEEKNKEECELRIQIEKTKRECDNKVKELELSIEVKKREIAEKDKDLALQGAKISELKSALLVRKEREEKEALRRYSYAQIEELKKSKALLEDQLNRYKSDSHRSTRSSSSEHSDYM